MGYFNLQHDIELGLIVELANGERLFVCKNTRDCDGTPLYSLGVHGCNELFNG